MAARDAIDYRAVFECVPTPLVLLSANLTILEMNQAYVDAVGRSRDALAGRHVFDAFPAPDALARTLRDSLNRALRTGEPDYLPILRYPIPTADERAIEERVWSVSHIPLRDSEGTLAFVLQNSQDVTDMHRATHDESVSAREAKEEALGQAVLDRAEHIQALNFSLLQESTQLRTLFMRAPSFMCLLRGADYRFELANNAFLALVGQRELVGRTVREAIPEAEGQVYLSLLDKVYRTGEPFIGKQMRAEFERVPGAGREEVFLNFVYQPIFGEDGRVAAIFVDGNDVTDHVKAERSQALLVRELHHRVRNTLATVQGS